MDIELAAFGGLGRVYVIMLYYYLKFDSNFKSEGEAQSRRESRGFTERGLARSEERARPRVRNTDRQTVFNWDTNPHTPRGALLSVRETRSEGGEWRGRVGAPADAETR